MIGRHPEMVALAAALCAMFVLLAAFAPRPMPAVSYAPVAAREENGLARRDGRLVIDLNTADSALLTSLPGIGDALAERIVAYREAHGVFSAVADLGAVPGIGPAKLAALEGRVAAP